jgi:hypothetical protein
MEVIVLRKKTATSALVTMDLPERTAKLTSTTNARPIFVKTVALVTAETTAPVYRDLRE